jgi:hypothetical protein
MRTLTIQIDDNGDDPFTIVVTTIDGDEVTTDSYQTHQPSDMLATLAEAFMAVGA